MGGQMRKLKEPHGCHYSYVPAAQRAQPLPPSQCTQVLPCLHPHRRSMGHPRSLPSHLASLEIPRLAHPQDSLPCSAILHARRVHRRWSVSFRHADRSVLLISLDRKPLPSLTQSGRRPYVFSFFLSPPPAHSIIQMCQKFYLFEPICTAILLAATSGPPIFSSLFHL